MDKYGKQYELDDKYKKEARLHQSKYRENVLKVGWENYGNRINEVDAKLLLNYFDGLGVRMVLRNRYRSFSKTRDTDMLRSEHIPFNLLGPLCNNYLLARRIIRKAFRINSHVPYCIWFEYAPKKDTHLDDATAFDTYIQFISDEGQRVGIGIEVKYTENTYPVGKKEENKVNDKDSRYWQVTRDSKAFLNPNDEQLKSDTLRQIWRNHLLGLTMCLNDELDEFYSVVIFPDGNRHFHNALSMYRALLVESSRDNVFGCTYESYIRAIEGDSEIIRWKQYLLERYIVDS